MYIGFAIGLFIVSYLIQLLLCFKAKNKHIKLIPFYIGLIIAFIGLLMYAELFGDMSTGSFVGNMHILSAIIIWIAVLIMYAGLLLAKITHIVVKAIQRRNDR